MAIDKTIGIARHVGYKVLCDVYLKGAYSNLSIQKHFSVLKKSEDRALATAIIFGTLKKNIQLTKVVQKLSSIAYEQIKPEIAVLIKSALYQLFYMDRLPAYAVVNDSVNLTKFYISSKSGSFVNAVLRSALRQGKASLFDEEKQEDFCASLEKDYDIPDWLCHYLKNDFSQSFLHQWAQAYQRSPKMYVRVNLLKISVEQAFDLLNKEQTVCAKTILPDVFEAVVASEVLRSKLFSEGAIVVQDMSSALCAYALEAQAGDSVLDLCAAPGGKSLHIASLTAGRAHITACDIYKNKTLFMKKQFAAMGVGNIQICRNDATVFNPAFEKKFDRVLTDVPCSGLGVIQRKPEILLHLNEKKIADLVQIQKSILENAAKYVKPKGVLVYSTCSINPRENRYVTEAFLSANTHFSYSSVSLPKGATEHLTNLPDGEIEIYPGDSFGDGFYICKMQRA